MQQLLESLLEAACAPDNFDAFLRRVTSLIMRRLGPGTAVHVLPRSGRWASFFPPAKPAPRGGFAIREELRPGGDRAAYIIVRLPKSPADKALVREAVRAAAALLASRLAGELSHADNNAERNLDTAIRNLEENFLSNPGLTPRELSRLLLDEARRLTGSPGGIAGLLTQPGNKFELAVYAGPAGKQNKPAACLQEGPCAWVIRNRKPLLANCPAKDRRLKKMKLRAGVRFLGVPALAGGRLLGVLALAGSKNDYTAAHLKAMRRLAQVYALILERKFAEEARAQEQERLNTIFNSSQDLIYSAGLDGRLTYISRQVSNYGYTQEQVIGRPVFSFCHPDDLRTAKAVFERAIASGKTLPMLNYRLRAGDGSYFNVEQKSGIVFAGGKPVMITGVIRDVTHKLKAEAALHEREARYRTLFENVNSAIFLADAKTGTIIDVNPDAEKLTGRTRAELIGIHQSKLHPADEVERYRKYFKTNGKNPENTLENVEVERKDGTRVPVIIKPSKLILDGREVIQGVFTDITELKKTEQKYRALINSTDTGYLILDAKGRVLEANNEYLRLTGRRKMSDIIGRQVTEWTAPYDKQRNGLEVNNILKLGSVRSLAVDYEWPNGRINPIEINASVIKTGDTVQVLSLCRDITERRLTEARLRESEERYRLLFDSMADPVFIHGENGNILAVNTAACRTYGYTRAEFLEMSAADIELEQKNAGMSRQVARLLASSHIRLETRHRLKDGSEISVEVVALAMTWNGSPATLNTCRDITARKKAEAALRDNETRYRALFTNSRDALMLIDLPAGKFAQANKTTLKMFALDKESALTKITPWSLSPERQPDGTLSAEKGPRLLAETLEKGESFFEWMHRRSDGTDFPAEVLLSRIEIVGKAAILATVRDISARKRMEQQIKSNETFLAGILNNIPDMVFVKDAKDLKFLTLNKAGERLLGVRLADVTGTTDYDSFPREEADFFTAKDTEVLISGRLLDIPEEKIHTPSGEKLLHTKKIPIYGPDGKPMYLLGISEDITERKKTEEKLRQSEQRLQLAMSQFNGILWVMDKDLRFLMSRGQGLRSLGLTEDQVVGLTLEEFIRPAGPHNASVPAHRLALMGECSSYEESFGNTVFDITVSPVKGADGEVSGVLGIAFDVTEKKRLETMLRQNEQTLQQIFDTADDAIFLKSLEGKYIKVNKACSKLFLTDHEQMIGKRAENIWPPQIAEEVRSSDREVLLAGRTVVKNSERVTPDGSKLYLSVARTPLRDIDGNITGILGVARDITGLKTMETELAVARAAEALSKVARPMAHDFNNALAAIAGYASLVSESMPDNNPAKNELDQILKAVMRAAELTSRLQDFARNPTFGEQPARGAPPQKPPPAPEKPGPGQADKDRKKGQ